MYLSSTLLFVVVIQAAFAEETKPYTKHFPLGECTFVTEGTNPHFLLQIGREIHMDNSACVAAGDCDEAEDLVIAVLDETRDISMEIDGVPQTITTRVVQESENADGQLVEISRNFFAECAATRDVYYFGEEVDIYEDNEIVSHEGAWEAGVDDAKPGLIMPGGALLLGSRYYQELAGGIAKDRAEHVKDGITKITPAGTFNNCVKVKETSPLEPGHVSIKLYCPGVGTITDNEMKLTEVVE
jgi:hypothetical protein